MKPENQKGIEKEQFLAIVNNLVDGLMVFNEGNRLFLTNPAAERFFQVKEEEILGKSITEFAELPFLKNLFYLLGKEIKEVFKQELEIKEGLILEVSSLPLLVQGEKTGRLLILHDITREKTVERTKAEFISIAAHQLRTPLSAIKWSLEMLLKEGTATLVPAQKKIIEETLISAKKVITLLNIFLDTAKIEEGKYIGKSTFCRLEEIIQGVIKSYQKIINEKQIKFSFQILNEKLPKIKVDLEMITLAIQGLVDNAVRYTPVGGIIFIILRADGEEIEFAIQDTGIGIPRDQQKNIFKKFFRASNAVKAETAGNGLSLFVAENIIKAHQGRIWFESEENKGTTFWFTIPLISR